jgi:hypothetical protein
MSHLKILKGKNLRALELTMIESLTKDQPKETQKYIINEIESYKLFSKVEQLSPFEVSQMVWVELKLLKLENKLKLEE